MIFNDLGFGMLPPRTLEGSSSIMSLDVFGPAHWKRIHSYPYEHRNDWSPAAAREWYNSWRSEIPAIGCDCQIHWRDIETRHPPRFETARAFYVWSWERHNDVNEIAIPPKPFFALEAADEIFWPSGCSLQPKA